MGAARAERRRRAREAAKASTRPPRHRYRQVSWALPDPADRLFREAMAKLVEYRRESEPGYSLGEQDFAIHLIVVGSRETLKEIEQQRQAKRLVQPATSVPAWAKEASERLQAIKGARA